MQVHTQGYKKNHFRRYFIKTLGLVFKTAPFLLTVAVSADNALARCTSESKAIWAADKLVFGWEKANEKKDQRIRNCLVRINHEKMNRVSQDSLKHEEGTHAMFEMAVSDQDEGDLAYAE
ncbi:hypothetical protein [Shewanella atlantica]|uniref:Uncharacterized protein n=1 Tax=Shewanella atlantica TaxID=271099 RepID=A0A3S0LCZ0_9GAMM|nr:hypothetical protein [Shewanella atlantica]RTR32523.1 hypothetical protein EKG39_09070 [Shewanella atlantica]